VVNVVVERPRAEGPRVGRTNIAHDRGGPGRKRRVANVPLYPPGGAVPSIPSTIHTAGCVGTGTLGGFRNGTSERVLLVSPCTATLRFVAFRCASANGIAQTGSNRNR
jgi:hypothetical protein